MALEEYQLIHAAFDLWVTSEGEDNRAELNKVKRILPIVLDECCTVTQKKYMMRYFADRKNIPQIAKEYRVDTSTVSRTKHRGLDNAYKALRFVSPLFIKAPKRRVFLRQEVQHEP